MLFMFCLGDIINFLFVNYKNYIVFHSYNVFLLQLFNEVLD